MRGFVLLALVGCATGPTGPRADAARMSDGPVADTDGADLDGMTPPSADAAPVSGHIVVQLPLPDGHIYRLPAAALATPVDLSAKLDLFSPGNDASVNVSPDGAWYVVNTTRFGCTDWACLAILRGDFNAAAKISWAGTVVHPDGGSAIAAGGMTIVFSGNSTHTRDLLALHRLGTDLGAWSAPVELTTSSPFAINDYPAISDDGQRVIFDCADVPYAGPGTGICEVKTDGTGFRVVLRPTDGPGGTMNNEVHHPDYAPDGTLVFEADWTGERVWRWNQIDPPAVVGDFTDDNSPCVLPDGRIVSLWLDRPGGASLHELKVMTPDGASFVMALVDKDVADIGIGCGP